MTKKLILILLCVLMILLPSCAGDKEKDPSSTGITTRADREYYSREYSAPILSLDEELSEVEKTKLRQLVESTQTREGIVLDHSQKQIDSSVVSVHWGGYPFWSIETEYFNMPYGKLNPDYIVLVHEQVLFPEAEGEYSYIFFPNWDATSSFEVETCQKAMMEGGMATFSFLVSYPEFCNGMMYYGMAIAKVKNTGR